MGDGNRAGKAEGPGNTARVSAAAFVLVLTVLALMPNQRAAGGAEGVPHVTPSDVLVGLALLAWLADLILYRRPRDVKLPPWGPVLYASWVAGVTIWAIVRRDPSRESVKESVQMGLYFVIASVLFADVLRSPERFRAAGYVLLGSGTAVVVLALAQGLRGPLLPSFGSPERIHAVRALFENNHVLSCYLAMLAPLCAGVALFWPSWPVRIWACALAVLSAALIFNGGLLAAMVVSTVAVAAIRGGRHAAGAACAVFVLTFLVLPWMPRERARCLSGSVSIFSKWHDCAIVSYRYRRAQAGVSIFRSHPLTGAGPGMFQKHVGRQQYHMLDDGLTPTPTPPEDVVERNRFVDNRYVLTAAELGLPGLLILVSALILGCGHALRAAAGAGDERVKALLAGCFGMIVAAAIGGIFTDFLVRGLALSLVFALSVPKSFAGRS